MHEPDFCPWVHDLCSFFLATKVGLIFLLCVDPELSRGKNTVGGTCHLMAVSSARYVFATHHSMMSRGSVWQYFSSSHFPGNQFDLLFWILKSETINSSCLLLNSEGSEHLVHAVMREAIGRGTTSARQSGGSAINTFSSLICEPSWSPEHWDLQLYSVPLNTSHDCLTPRASLLTCPKCLWSCTSAVPRNSSVASKGDGCKAGISIIYSPHANKHAYAIHTPSVLIVTEQHVFSTRAGHLLRLFRVTECCSDALLLSAGSSICWGEREWFLLGQKELPKGELSGHPDMASPLTGFMCAAQEGGQLKKLRLLPVLV